MPINGGCGDSGTCTAQNAFTVAQSSAGNIIEIKGVRFGEECSKLLVTFQPAIADINIHTCSNELITVTTGSTVNVATGEIRAVVKHTDNGESILTPIGTVVPQGLDAVFLSNNVDVEPVLLGTASALRIRGTFPSVSKQLYRVYASMDGGKIKATVNSDPSATLDVTISGLTNLHHGFVNVVVTLQGVATFLTRMAHVQASAPAVRSGSFKLSHSSTGNRLEIHGERFGNSASDIAVELSGSLLLDSTAACGDVGAFVTFTGAHGVDLTTSGSVKKVLGTDFMDAGAYSSSATDFI